MIPISKFASQTGNPLCTYMNRSSTFKENTQLPRLWFMAGDPTAYGHESIKMEQRGYEILRQSILNLENHGYIQSPGDRQARQNIAELFGGNKNISFKDVGIVHGANMGLLYCLFAFCEAGDNILVPEFGYPFYNDVAKSLDIEARFYRLKENQNFQIDLQHVQSLINERTKYLFVINPSNPMGSVFSRQHMRRILKLAEQNTLPIVADQVYYGQSFEEDEFVSFGQLADEVPVITISGLQKMFYVPGWSTSWYIIHDKNNYLHEIRGSLEKISTIFLHTNVFTQRAIPKLFKELGKKFGRKMIPVVKINHDYLIQRFSNYPEFKVYPARGTFYLTVQIILEKFVGIGSDIEFIERLVQDQNINIFPTSVMGSRFAGFRMMTCAKEEQYQQFFRRLDNFLAKYRKSI